MRGSISWVGAIGVTISILVACSSKSGSGFGDPGSGDGDGGGILGGDGGFGGGGDGAPGGLVGDPTTCEQAAQAKTYIGCDYWPTVVANNVWSVFDFAAVVANAGNQPADITVTGPNGTNQKLKVAPQQLVTVYLPWVQTLKGPDADSSGNANPLTTSVFAAKGAYHLVSTFPVTVYQFNALEYQGNIESIPEINSPEGLEWQADTIAHFDTTLRRMAAISQDAHVPLLFVSPVSNLEWPPFKSEHRAGLSAADFVKYISVQTISRKGFLGLADSAEAFAESEGLLAHRNAVRIRR
jgi:hypothetical protein